MRYAEEDSSEAQLDAAEEAWSNYGHSEFIKEVKSYLRSEAAKDRLDNLTLDQTWVFHIQHAPIPYEEDDYEGVYFPFGMLKSENNNYLTRDLVATLLKMSKNT